MKNLPVGRKLFLGFGIVVPLIMAILGVTMVTSIDRNRQLDEISTMSDLTNEANDVLDDVDDARVDLRTVFTASEYDAEYENALALLQSGQARLDTLEGYAAQLDAGTAVPYNEAAALLRQQFGTVIPIIESIHTNDAAVTESTPARRAPPPAKS